MNYLKGLCFSLLCLPVTLNASIKPEVLVPFGADYELQPPVLYVHGWADDGALWARYDGSSSGSCFPDRNNEIIEPSASLFLERAGIENWAVQWWSTDNGNNFSSADEGFAFLSNAEELIDDSTWENDRHYMLHNKPCPSAADLALQGRLVEALTVPTVNTYNDSGSVVDHATDLLEMLQRERAPGGKLAPYRQVNIITHSKGSLVARTMLSMAADGERDEYEFVANVVYNAPPFAGSSVADMFAPLFGNEDPSIIGILNNEFFQATFGTDPNTSIKTALENYLDLVVRVAGFEEGLSKFKQLLPPGSLLPLELLAPFTLAAANLILDDIQADNDASLKLLVDTITTYTGFPARPALDDLMLQASKDRLLTYATSDFSKQFVTVGNFPVTRVGGGIPTTLFPCDINNTSCVEAIELDPNLLSINAGAMLPSNSDGVVSLGSARLLAETDRFGEALTLLAEKPFWHGDMTRPDVVGSEWLQALTAAPTDMLIEGEIDDAYASSRLYQVSLGSAFKLIPRTIQIESSIRYPVHTPGVSMIEYRIIKGQDEDLQVSEWVIYNAPEDVLFSDLATAYSLLDVPFKIEWRSHNDLGGKEMIRSAQFVILAGPPKLVDANIITPNSAEVSRRDELEWIISNPGNKALSLLLDSVGDLVYAWNQTSLDTNATTTLAAVQGTVIPLDGLAAGYNSLLFQTRNNGQNSVEQEITLFVDDNPPQVEFECKGVDSFTCYVGANTPIRYSIRDNEFRGATGRLLNFSDTGTDAGEFFTLSETSLAEDAIIDGLVGGTIDLTVRATDRVNNSVDEVFTVYYDWTAPIINVESVDALPIEGGYRAFTSQVEIVVSVDSDNGGFSAPVANVIPAIGGVLSSPPFALNPGTGLYTAFIPLHPGDNRVIIATQDIAGNLATHEVRIEFSQVDFDDNPVEIMSARVVSADECVNANGDSILCTLGNIENVVTSYHGDVAAFRSNGNRFVANDFNGGSAYDVFAWRDGVVNLVSVSQDGVQADAASRSLAISGNGRFVYFASTATSLVDDTADGNLYLKDLDTGEIAVITKDPDGGPINHPQGMVSPNFSSAAATYNGRYVFFVSHSFANGTVAYIDGLTYPGNNKQIYMVDLDPDANGYLFDDNYEYYPISSSSDTAMGNGDSVSVSVSLDGRYLAFQTAATDIDADLAINGATRDIVLMEFSGSANDGTLDTSFDARTVTVIAQDAGLPKVAPNSDTVAYLQLSGAVDFNVYSSSRNISGSIDDRTVSLVSEQTSGGESSGGGTILDVAIADDTESTGIGHKVAWASLHADIVAGDNNGVRDLFVRRESDVYPENLPVPNWIDGVQPSSAEVVGSTATLSGDGRYAFWVSRQEYFSPYDGDGERHLFRRRIDPPNTSILTIDVQGNGSVLRSEDGTEGAQDGDYIYDDESRIQLTAIADVGARFVEWQDVDFADTNSAQVYLAQDRAVVAVFENTNRPYAATANITTNEDMRSSGVIPDFIDDDVGDAHTFTIVGPAANGVAAVINNRLVYTPDEDFNGVDNFQFQVTDLSGLQLDAAAFASVEVVPVNDRPTATSLNITTERDLPSLPVSPSVVDIDDGDTFSFSLVSQPGNGEVEIVGNQFRYTPNAGFVGVDSFNYRAMDSGELSVIGTATVEVVDVSDPAVNDNQEDDEDNGSGSSGAFGLNLLFALIALLLAGVRARKTNLQGL